MEKRNVKTYVKDYGLKIIKLGIISWILFFIIWSFGASKYDEYFLPGPLETWDSIKTLFKSGVLVEDIIASVSRSLKGWLIAILTAVPIGLLIGNFKVVRWIVEPFVTFFRFIPAIALTTMFLLWFGTGDTSKIALIIYAAFFPMLVNTIAAVASVDKSLVEAAYCMGAKRVRVFFTVVVPSAVPGIFTGIRLGLSSSILCVIGAEMLVGSNGLGYLINSSKLYYKTGWAFAGIFTLAAFGFIADRLLILAGSRGLKRFGVKK